MTKIQLWIQLMSNGAEQLRGKGEKMQANFVFLPSDIKANSFTTAVHPTLGFPAAFGPFETNFPPFISCEELYKIRRLIFWVMELFRCCDIMYHHEFH